jgi:hypothetical protein
MLKDYQHTFTSISVVLATCRNVGVYFGASFFLLLNGVVRRPFCASAVRPVLCIPPTSLLVAWRWLTGLPSPS